jgi:hypothetical protein
MNAIYIYTKSQWDAWREERRCYDPDFDGEACHWLSQNKFPFRVIWCDTESNGYPHVEYMVEDALNPEP